jgi:di/tricarboxylate transporter
MIRSYLFLFWYVELVPKVCPNFSVTPCIVNIFMSYVPYNTKSWWRKNLFMVVQLFTISTNLALTNFHVHFEWLYHCPLSRTRREIVYIINMVLYFVASSWRDSTDDCIIIRKLLDSIFRIGGKQNRHTGDRTECKGRFFRKVLRLNGSQIYKRCIMWTMKKFVVKYWNVSSIRAPFCMSDPWNSFRQTVTSVSCVGN